MKNIACFFSAAVLLLATPALAAHPKTIKARNQPLFKPEAHVKAPAKTVPAAAPAPVTNTPEKPAEKKKTPNAYTPRKPAKPGMKTELKTTHADDHNPLGVWPDLRPKNGDWEYAYAVRHSRREGLRSGKGGVNAADVNNASGAGRYAYATAPLRLDTTVHQLGAVYGVNDRTALALGVPFILNNMDNLTTAGAAYRTKSEGLGDATVTGLWKIPTRGGQWQATVGLGLPTGSVDEKDDTPLSGGVRAQLPYAMQLGTGAFDLQPGLVFQRRGNPWTVGARVGGAFALGDNKRHYKPGARYHASAWGQYNFSQRSAASARLLFESFADMNGADAALNPALDPGMDGNQQGGRRLSLGVGLNILGPDRSDHHRLSLEVLAPLWQTLNGPQLEMDRQISVGWQADY